MDQYNSDNYEIEAFFDGGCPLCRREMAFLHRRDHRGKIRFTDISASEFRAADFGMTHEALMAQMHGRLPDGTWLRGVEVFRRMYAAIGCRVPVWLSRLPVIRHLLDWSYAVFARNRYRLTGRCSDASCSAAPKP